MTETMTIAILLTEDHDRLRNGYLRYLERFQNIPVIVTQRAQEGLDEAFAFFDRYPNGWLFVLTDNDMPSQEGDSVRSGVEMARAIKKRVSFRAYILLATGGAPPQETSFLNDVVGKPFELKRIDHGVKTLTEFAEMSAS